MIFPSEGGIMEDLPEGEPLIVPLAVPALRKDGTRLSLEFTIILLRDAAGDLLGPAAILRDVTARWQRDKALKERLAALEAQVRGTHGLAGDERRDGGTQERGIPPR
jgi:hypothetical protein